MPQSKAELLQIAHDRLYPSLTNPNYLVLRSRRRLFEKWIQRLPHNLVVLDLGGRYQPYRPLLHSRSRRYVAFDVLPTVMTDVVGRGETMPFRPDSFDLVVATQVFEYFAEPQAVAVQVHQVLKPGGILLMSVAAMTPRFVAEEHWRFLPAGLRSVLSAFDAVETVPEVYSLGGLCRTVNVGFELMAKTRPLQAVYRATGAPLLNLLGLTLEGMQLTKNDQLTANYSVFARKATI